MFGLRGQLCVCVRKTLLCCVFCLVVQTEVFADQSSEACSHLSRLIGFSEDSFQQIKAKKKGGRWEAGFVLPGASICEVTDRRDDINATYECRWIFSRFRPKQEVFAEAESLYFGAAKCFERRAPVSTGNWALMSEESGGSKLQWRESSPLDEYYGNFDLDSIVQKGDRKSEQHVISIHVQAEAKGIFSAGRPAITFQMFAPQVYSYSP